MRPRRLLASCTLLVAVCGGCGDEPKFRGRVLLVGIDGASLRVAHPMIRAGRLPNLARIARQGVYGPLQAHIPLTSPRIWTSIATGKNPKSHGILSFARAGEDGVQRLYRSDDRKGHALWNIASDAGMTVAVVNWWTTYPVEKVRGVLVSDHLLAGEIQGRRKLTGAAEAAAGPIVYPEAWAARVQASASADGPLTAIPDPFAASENLPAWSKPAELSERYRNDERVTRIALEIEDEVQPDLMMVFLPGIDRVSHRLWGALEPAGPHSPFTPEQRVFAAEALRGYYRFSDALIGELVARYGPDDLVLVVSDHGFEGGSSMLYLTGEHKSPKAANGVIFARGPDVEAPGEKGPVSVNDVTPTILAWLGLALGEDMQGRPASFLKIDVAAIERIASYDTRPIERLGSGTSGNEAAMLEQLRSLGYMQDEDAP